MWYDRKLRYLCGTDQSLKTKINNLHRSFQQIMIGFCFRTDIEGSFYQRRNLKSFISFVLSFSCDLYLHMAARQKNERTYFRKQSWNIANVVLLATWAETVSIVLFGVWTEIYIFEHDIENREISSFRAYQRYVNKFIFLRIYILLIQSLFSTS